MSEPEFRWVHCYSTNELKEFYESILPAVREAARYCGYAIGLHGSFRRDMDLIAVPWTPEHSDKDALATAIHKAACGLTSQKYNWEDKGSGRFAAMFPVCWTEFKHEYDGAGHIDLSVVEVKP